MSWSIEEGHYEIYLDGALNVEGFNLSKSVPIIGDGIFIIGQEQDSLGGKHNSNNYYHYYHYYYFLFQEVSVNPNLLLERFPTWIFGIGGLI